MARVLVLIRFTQHGVKAIKNSPARARAFAAFARKAGVAVEAQYWTLGSRDGFLVLSAPKEAAILHCVTELAAKGNIHTETLPALDESQFKRILAGK